MGASDPSSHKPCLTPALIVSFPSERLVARLQATDEDSDRWGDAWCVAALTGAAKTILRTVPEHDLIRESPNQRESRA